MVLSENLIPDADAVIRPLAIVSPVRPPSVPVMVLLPVTVAPPDETVRPVDAVIAVPLMVLLPVIAPVTPNVLPRVVAPDAENVPVTELLPVIAAPPAETVSAPPAVKAPLNVTAPDTESVVQPSVPMPVML